MKASYEEYVERATAEIYTARTAYHLLGITARLHPKFFENKKTGKVITPSR